MFFLHTSWTRQVWDSGVGVIMYDGFDMQSLNRDIERLPYFFWFYAKPDSIVILHFELKKDFLLFWRHNWVHPTNIPVWAVPCKRHSIVGIYIQYVQFFQQIFVDSGWEFPSINSMGKPFTGGTPSSPLIVDSEQRKQDLRCAQFDAPGSAVCHARNERGWENFPLVGVIERLVFLSQAGSVFGNLSI